MAIRPVDVRRKEFKSSFRGYDANQVDDFLDAVADEFERTFADNQRLTDEVANLKQRLEQFEVLEDSIRSAIVHAEQASRDLRQNADKEAELIVREAKEQSRQILAESSTRVERVQKSYEVLNQAKEDFANDFRRLLKSYLSVMDNVDVASAKEIEDSLRERLDVEAVADARQAADTQRMERDEGTAEISPVGPQSEAGTGEIPRDDTGSEAASDSTQRIGPLSTPGSGVADSQGGEGTGGPAPEAEESEEDPSSVREPADRGAATPEAGVGAADEVDREEGIEAGTNRAADEFFDADRTERRRGEPAEGSGEERKLFRASRFLRRRE